MLSNALALAISLAWFLLAVTNVAAGWDPVEAAFSIVLSCVWLVIATAAKGFEGEETGD